MRQSIEPLEHRIAPAAIVAVTANNEILRFDSASPGTATTTPITGLGAFMGELLVGVDFRPATGGLYGFTVDDAGAGHLYLISLATGDASLVGSISSTGTLPLSNADSYGFDFNPVPDRIRVVTSTGQNFRLNPNNGALAGEDTDLSGASSSLVAAAYDRSFAGSGVTTLFGIDVGTNELVRQGSVDGSPQSPNGGVITSIGSLNVDPTAASFDIANGTGLAYAALTVSGTPGLYTVDLATGAATSIGTIGNGSATVVGIAAVPEQIRIVNAKTATYHDVDGDLVTIKITKGTLTADLFELGSGPDGGAYLRTLNLTDPMFAGSNVTITAKAGANGGDKLASIGYINATGNDLGTVKIAGDLTQIDAGNAAGGVGVKSLSVTSFGVVNPATSAGDLISSIEGSLNKLTVKRDFNGAQLTVSDSSSVDALGKIGSVSIGGSLVGQALTSSGTIAAESIGTVKIARDLQGGLGTSSGRILSTTAEIKSVTIGGSLIGGGGQSSGLIQSDTDLGSVNIKGSILGTTGFNSARIVAEGAVGSLVIGGSLVGGSAESAGRIDIDGTVKSLTIKGAIVGGSSEDTGLITVNEIMKMTVGGSIFGDGFGSASIRVDKLGSIRVGGDLSATGGSSARIVATGSLGSVSIGGSVTGDGFGGGNITANTIGTVSIGGSLVGTNPDSGVVFGNSIEKVTIGGDLSGTDSDAGLIRADEGNLGTVTIKGSIQGGNVSASGNVKSISVGGDVSSRAEDAIGAGGTLTSVTIKGSLNDTFGSGNITGDEIGKLTIGGSVANARIESSEGDVASISIAGSLVESTIAGGNNIGKITIGGDLIGSDSESGSIHADGKIDSVSIKGSITAGDDITGIFAGVLGKVSVGKDIAGNSTDAGNFFSRVTIAAVGTQATSGTTDLAIASVTVGGRVENADIAAGYDGTLRDGTPVNADAQIGKVTVGGDWIASNLVAGTTSEDSVFGDGDDFIIGEVGQVNTIVASIASITIKGSVDGTFGGTDGFAFTAEEIKTVSIGGVKQKLTAGKNNDNTDGLDPDFSLGATQDVRIREISVV